MTYEDIVTLAKAGFTAEQIARLSAVQNTTQPTVPAAPVAQPTQPAVPTVPTAQPTVPTALIAQPTVPGQNPIPANSPDYILQAINNVNDTMRQMQINMTNQPKPETTDDIIASIINPPMPSKEGNK